MQAEELGPGAVERVTVDAAVEVPAADQADLVERRQVPFVDADVGERLVTRCDEPVCDAEVDGVFADMDFERIEALPFPVKLSARRDLDRPAPGCVEQPVPCLYREIGTLSGCLDRLPVRTFDKSDYLSAPSMSKLRDAMVEGTVTPM